MEPANTLLRGIPIPSPKYTLGPLPDSLKKLKYYTNIQTLFPSLKKLFQIQDISNEIWLDNNYKISNVEIFNEEDIKGNCKIKVNTKSTEAYLKVTHLIDPVTYIKMKNENIDYTNNADLQKKINDPWNQAYVEALATYALGKLKQEDISPHFNSFYGAFTAIATKYCYNISDEVESYRLYKWFWNGIENKNITITINGVEDEVEAKEVYDEIMKKPDYCLDNNESSEDFEELIDSNIKELDTTELESLDSLSIKSFISQNKESENENSSEEEEEEEEEVKVLLNLYNFPVMMIFMDKNESTMDDLLEDYEEVGCEPNSKLWEEKWSAWLFQVLAALSVTQTLFGFIHNDLHSNNIVWEYTDELYLFYKTNDGKIFKVPTYGKLFKIIDFGRSIYSINEHIFISDDFKEGNDAATQYNFPELNGENSEKKIYPNPSFDLARLSISIFESLYPEFSKGPNSDLCNILWSWLIDIEGKNILWDDNEEERFPDFELYTHIAEKCMNSIPSQQIYKKPFSKFIVNSAPKNQKVYSLFV
uniref:Protein kinase domain-containing protein n=1 Tax=viral metagenome TaxID=1070528 RepID=A0A6C0D832_9ZZZZ